MGNGGVIAKGDRLRKVDKQATCMMLVGNICPDCPKKEDNLQCVEDI